MTDEEKAAADKKAAEEQAKKEADEKAAADKKAKTKFDTEQMELVNKLVNNAFRDGATKVEKELQAKLEAEKAEREKEKAEREKLAKEVEELRKATAKDDKPDTQLEGFKAQLAEVQTVLVGIKTERDELKKKVEGAEVQARTARKKDTFYGAIKDANLTFFDPTVAYDLAEKDGYDWDKDADKPVIQNKETGRPRLNENGEPMSVVDYVKHFAERNKYMVKAANPGGTGSGDNRNTDLQRDKKPEFPDFEKMSPEEFEAYQQKVLQQPSKN